MHEAAGILEVFGCVAAFVAADAAAKAADVRIEAIDKNKPANADALPVPLITCLKIREAWQPSRRPWTRPHRQRKGLPVLSQGISYRHHQRIAKKC